MNRLELIVFDCDGVLIDSEILACQAVADELSDLGHDYPAEVISRRFAGARDTEIAASVTHETGCRLPRDFADRVAARALRRFENELNPLAGAAELLAELTMPKCVASNSQAARLERSLEVAGLRHYFAPDAVFSADSVPRGKPAPDLHLYAARRMGADPAASLVIEDSESGVTAAHAAGMAVLGFVGASHANACQGERLRRAGAFEVVDDFSGVAAVLARY